MRFLKRYLFSLTCCLIFSSLSFSCFSLASSAASFSSRSSCSSRCFLFSCAYWEQGIAEAALPHRWEAAGLQGPRSVSEGVPKEQGLEGVTPSSTAGPPPPPRHEAPGLCPRTPAVHQDLQQGLLQPPLLLRRGPQPGCPPPPASLLRGRPQPLVPLHGHLRATSEGQCGGQGPGQRPGQQRPRSPLTIPSARPAAAALSWQRAGRPGGRELVSFPGETRRDDWPKGPAEPHT